MFRNGAGRPRGGFSRWFSLGRRDGCNFKFSFPVFVGIIKDL